MKKLLLLFTVASAPELFSQSTTLPVRHRVYNIFEINNCMLTTGELNTIFILGIKNIKKGKRYFRSTRQYWGSLNVFNFNKNNSLLGAEIKLYKGLNKEVDTIIYYDIELKYPIEVNGILN